MDMRGIAVAIAVALAGCASSPVASTAPIGEERTATWFEALRDRPPMVRAFLQRMPKGADIHTHLAGAVYAESYIAWSAGASYRVDTSTYTITACCPPACSTRAVADALRDATFYNALIDGLSTRNLADRRQSGRNQFFAVFERFGQATRGRLPAMVAEIATRAADQRIGYLEIMQTVRGSEVRQLGAQTPFDRHDLAGSRQRLLDAGLRNLVPPGSRDVDDLEREVARILACATAEPLPACRVARRYLQQSLRTVDPNIVFAQLLYAFELATAEPRIVGVNLVAPEDDRVALHDYRLHMQMIGWLRGQYPTVNVTLHAGELALGLVPPEELRFHIREAIEVGGARRIGHGVTVGYERGAAELLEAMRQRDVLVEICLTSNDVILGVRGPNHPFPDYLKAGVPVTLATDDEGVSRIDLTHEYARAAETYRLGYRALKQLSRNSLTYSFLPGASLWRNAARAEIVPACAGRGSQPSAECRAFLDTSEKARLQWALERDLDAFEETVEARPRP